MSTPRNRTSAHFRRCFFFFPSILWNLPSIFYFPYKAAGQRDSRRTDRMCHCVDLGKRWRGSPLSALAAVREPLQNPARLDRSAALTQHRLGGGKQTTRLTPSIRSERERVRGLSVGVTPSSRARENSIVRQSRCSRGTHTNGPLCVRVGSSRMPSL